MPEGPTFLAGRGIADITGEVAGCGLLGYGKADQIADGLHQRLRARAFVVVDSDTERRVLIVVAETPLMFQSVHEEVLRRLAAVFGELYTFENVMITATHTHCGPGGYSEHMLYNSNTHGFRPLTFAAIVDGIVEAAERAHADVAPAHLVLAHGELHDASTNRSPQSFARNPAADRAFFPEGIDPQTSVLRIERDGRPVGVINWFPTHGTSMTNQNTLVGGDNKGYAAYEWERLVEGVDYLDDGTPSLVAAFSQTNSGDMSPNLNRRPGSGPTEDDAENTRIIGQRQCDAAARLVAEPGDPLTGGLDVRTIYVDMAKVVVRPEFTPDGREHRTGPPAGGAAAFAGTDEGPAFPGFHQGRNRVWDGFSKHVLYRLSPALREAQSPKGVIMPGGVINRLIPLVQEKYPVQLMRLGHLYLVGLPGEPTIVAGLRLRRTVAGIVGADLRDVLVIGYCNAYMHYVTTPEEYDEQRYEGGSTLFGRWELPALLQVVSGLAVAIRDGTAVGPGPRPPDLRRRRKARRRPIVDEPMTGRHFGDVVEAPRPSYERGARVRAVFAGAHPTNDLHRGSTYIEVQQQIGPDWVRIADDSDWSTTFRWKRAEKRASRVTVTWDIPGGAEPGVYRICYHGDARDQVDRIRAFDGITGGFEVR